MRAVMILVLAAGAACSDDVGPGVGSLDGNVLTWEGPARPAPDAGARDGGRPDDAAPPDARDADVPEPDAGDAAAPEDAGVDPCEQAPSATVTASVAQADPALVGRIIEVRGRLTPGDLQCTGGPCGDDDRCCEACAASMTLDGVLPLAASECRGALVGCSGSNCATTCSPPVLGGEVRVVGQLTSDGAALEVWAVQP